MLYLLMISLIAIHGLSAVIDLFRHRYLVSEIKMVVLVVLLFLIYGFVKTLEVERFAFVLTCLLEAELTLIVLHNTFLHFSLVYPTLVTFGLFFFFPLKRALWFALVHHLYWFSLFWYGHESYPNHPVLHDMTALIGLGIVYIFMVLFGLFYALSIGITYEELRRSNRQKEILLGEIHHRIKNNLNMMASVLGLQILNIQNHKTKNAADALLNAKLRIQSMAMVHESIYKQKDFDEISFYNYVHALTKLINSSYGKQVEVQVESDYLYIPMAQMIHLGIIIDELFTNSIKYAFNDEEQDKITISLFDEGTQYRFVYHENHNYHVDIEKMMHSDTLGIKLLKLTVSQMDGKLHVTKNNGLRFTITFPKMK
jgi:two-component sensor histidine kinase